SKALDAEKAAQDAAEKKAADEADKAAEATAAE
ncbi:50S ribosomal protein L19, partial [Mesorhizobium sp. M0767]